MNKRRTFVIAAIALAALAGLFRSHSAGQPQEASAALHVEPHRATSVRAHSLPTCTSPRRRSRKSRSRDSGRRADAETAPVSRVDLNRAGVADLETLPGIGQRLAERIVAFREQNGPYTTLDDLLDVNGVSERVVDALEPYVTFDR